MSWFLSSVIMLEHLVSVCRSNETADIPRAFDILSSVPDDLAYKVLDCLSLSQRMVASLACKSWGCMCINNLSDVNITVEDLQHFESAQIWLGKTLTGRESTLRSLIVTYEHDLLSDWSHRVKNPLMAPEGKAGEYLLPLTWAISCTID